MSSPKTPAPEQIIRRRVGEIPLLQAMASRLRFRDLLVRYIAPHGNETIPAVDTLMLLLFNITSGRQPLYELEQWVLSLEPRLFGFERLSEGTFGDDRFGRALDKLYLVDRASLMTEVAMRVVEVLELDLSRIHNDSTTVRAFGRIAGKTRTGMYLARGVSKDHRPDLKQLVYSLTISADGAVPIHHKAYPGNRTDDTTHIETWRAVRKIAGRADFLYVADCKVCTEKQLSYIVGQGGRVVTVVPETWKETSTFKQTLRSCKKQKRVIFRVEIPGQSGQYETFSCFVGDHYTSKAGHRIHWIYSTEKKKRDRQSRETALKKAEAELTELMGKLNIRNLKTEEQIRERTDAVLEQHDLTSFYHIKLSSVKVTYRKQVSKGRPGPNTKYEMIVNTYYTLSWARNQQALAREKNTDGIFPILCTDTNMTAKEALVAYKYQPRLEKRFTQFKGIHNAAPLLFKKIERVEAIMFLFFLALILQAAIEREVRLKMSEQNIGALPVYPEHRIAHHPTTGKIFDRFHDLSTYRLVKGKRVVKEYHDSLSDLQLTIIDLLNAKSYWPRP